ncbi:hypothetical protein SAMN05216229_12346 [Geopseudomonas sagittaria]|uniref:Uncharacterized protein n=1 Tax=Geopseudomonas sagittaria TaxID=1135990 RepID=A0A1I5YRM6_9GAMM|nr:hypothetical protein [Pseudomonas sagittaria]SFQ46527.1 hypothetical protein SAMN05216229_12346 [Pseudomonas sagittaria]
MNDELRAAVERLFAACLDVTLAGKYHAHMRYSAHCGAVCITLYPASTPYKDGDCRVALVDSWIFIHDERCMEGDEVARIHAVIDQLSGYLQEEAA